MSASIRLATKKDAAQVQAIYSPVVTQSAASFELEPPSARHCRRTPGWCASARAR
jgi:phosphinothricin acetyltransferase